MSQEHQSIANERNVFIDGKHRNFIHYKGWIISSDGNKPIRDPLTIKDEGPLEIICDPLGLGIRDNLLKADKSKVIEKGVRKIEYYSDGYYLIEDNNEYELSKGLCASGYREKHNVVFDDGRLLSNDWFDQVYPSMNGYFLVERNGRFNLLDFNGNPIQNEYETYMTCFDGEKAYACKGNCLFEIYSNGRKLIKKLNAFTKPGRYHLNCDEIEILPGASSVPELFSKYTRKRVSILYEEGLYEKGLNNKRVISPEGYLLFDNSFEDFHFSGIRGRYFMKNDGKWKCIDIAGKEVVDSLFDEVIPYCGNYVVLRQGNVYSLMDDNSAMIGGFDSVMWSDSGSWGMHLVTNKKRIDYHCGQGGWIVAYAQKVLASNKCSIFVGKEGIWYYYDGINEPIPHFRG